MQRKRAVIAEAVERSAARRGSDEVSVFSLIEERPSFLPRPGGSQEADAVFVHFDLARNFAVQNDGLSREAFLRAEGHIVSGQDSYRLDQRSQRPEDLLPEGFEPRAHELQHYPGVIAIANQGRTAVCFAVDQTKSVGVLLERNPSRDRGGDALVPP